MKIGIDIGDKNISAALLNEGVSVNYIDKSIYDRKRDSNRAIMDKVLDIINSVSRSQIKGIGLSLPSKIDKKRGVIYDLMKIPYWKGQGIRKIIEDEFNTRVWVNNDVNCFMLAEKRHGLCKDFKNALCLTLGPNIGLSVTMDGKLYMGNKYLFNNAKCLSIPSYDCIRIYRDSFIRTVEDLEYLCDQIDKNKSSEFIEKQWDEFGIQVGRLISILLCNYEPEVIVLGGSLGKSFANYSKSMDKYLEEFIHPHVLLNLVFLVSAVDYPQALGATSLVNPILL